MNLHNADKMNKGLDFELLRDRVYKAIKERIINLTYEPGQQLVEHQLSDDLGVSKSPIRDSFQRLEKDGLVRIFPYKGCFVSEVTIEEFNEIFQLREALEIYCIEKGLILYTDEDLERFGQIMACSERNLKENDRISAYNAHIDFHCLIVRKLGNKLIEKIYFNIREKLERYLNIALKYMEDRVEISNQEHLRILNTIEHRDVLLAVQELKNHLSSILEDYMQCDVIRRFMVNH